MKTRVISYKCHDTLDNTHIAEIPSFCWTSENRGQGMKLPVEENSINHCGGRGNPKETGTYGSRTVRTCVCYWQKYTRSYTCRRRSLFTLKGKGEKNRPPVSVHPYLDGYSWSLTVLTVNISKWIATSSLIQPQYPHARGLIHSSAVNLRWIYKDRATAFGNVVLNP